MTCSHFFEIMNVLYNQKWSYWTGTKKKIPKVETYVSIIEGFSEIKKFCILYK